MRRNQGLRIETMSGELHYSVITVVISDAISCHQRMETLNGGKQQFLATLYPRKVLEYILSS